MKRLHAADDMTLYLTDESRRTGSASEICFPETDAEIRQILCTDARTPVTMQGSRTGVTAGAVPEGGTVINLSSMDRILALPESAEDPAPGESFTAIVQPGVLLCRLQETLKPLHLFFPPDPTETTASIGGMGACNSSGARSYRYGATRSHILSLKLLLADGDSLTIRRGQHYAKAGTFALTTDGGKKIEGTLPQVRMPAVSKHTAGYYLMPDMDLIDLFIGSEGTLGIVTEIEVSLRTQPKHLWGAIAFFAREADALHFVHLLRGDATDSGDMTLPISPEAIEFFGRDTLAMLREEQSKGAILTDMTQVPDGCAVYIEIASDDRALLEPVCRRLGAYIVKAGGDPDCSWFSFHGPDMQKLKDFRHAAPVCVNEAISEIRKQYPPITKLGTDMSVPDGCLDQVFAMYRDDLAREGFLSSLFGHIGNNHLHVNIIPRSPEEYDKGKSLISRWADAVVSMGGSVSAEHGIGKLKAPLLRRLYAPEDIEAMFRLKYLFDPELRLNPGNIFGFDLR